jgi:hypothetical protein
VDNFNWLPLLIIAVIVLAGQGRKLVAGARSPAAQAARQAYLQAAQAEAERAAAAAVPVRPAAPRPAVVPTPPRPLRAMMPPAGSAPTAALPAPPMHTFIRAAFADPAHARRAIVLAEILLPPPALR